MLHLIRGSGGSNQYRPALIVEVVEVVELAIETQPQAVLHYSTVPHAVHSGFESFPAKGTMSGMQTQTIERTDADERVDDGTGSDTPKYFHYVKKDKIAESAVMGSHVVALCGEVFPVTRAPKPGSPVCPDCKRIYDTLKKG
ncbi:Protein of uncharacterised function (DUF3039) [Mycobacterium tuberculosis]|nr:Protein of uncharacterised function (DUF3039) [Mycobacterium tuberculosis]CFE82215.1 Protein of uncharacterised function (DUF3039) [Mycobacterium tuberculosis]CFR37815.1 Protein of uncharacterised function (DUF3039) [Mycobacterium tuberculosis]CFR70637.1 Protein of uncharacterised function (DUF3039) [Mycobacterium tuberculosis]CFR84323.1 Protein of uncharacterised function (DUF3039) [Mycobacterium tuberculosis]